MPNYKDLYGGRYLTAEKVGSNVVRGVITDCGVDVVDEETGRKKVVIAVDGIPKPIAVNATNAEQLGTAWGEDYLKWTGRTVEVSTARVLFGGKLVLGIQLLPVADIL